MNKAILISILLMIITITSVFAQDKKSFTTYWDNGLKIESADKNFKLKMGGRLQYDMMFMSQSSKLDVAFSDAYNGSELRRARYYFSGSIYSNISYKVQIDFAPNTIAVKDAYIALHKLPLISNIKVGKFKVPFGLNTLTSSKYLTFMERPTTSNFDSERHLGAMIYRHHLNKRLAWQAGFFYPNQDENKYHGNGYLLALRITGLPIYNVADNKYTLLHIGASFVHEFHNGNPFEIKNRPESHLAPKYSNFKIASVKFSNLYNVELAYIYNRISIQSEYHFMDFVPYTSSDDKHVSLNSFYGTLSYFITDDHRSYSQKKTFFGKVKPNNNYGKDGIGAIEIALRYSHLDGQTDHYVYGGEMNNIALGVNWYLNPAVKVAMNYVYSINPAYDGTADILQMRFQVAF
ncbi:MAG: hypothetical protein B6I18_03210 [Bacteroidetes bacterium 4572_112]|nr:MAG: hypothetical protein B6I18_03210 [Bacteroidetes bacterium 4572_112]